MAGRDGPSRPILIIATGCRPEAREAKVYIEHLNEVGSGDELPGVGFVNTSIGRDWTKSVGDNWPRFKRAWKPSGLERWCEARLHALPTTNG